MYTFLVVLISFYKKMTIKPQNDAMYGSNNSILFTFEWASCQIPGQDAFLGEARRPLSHIQLLLSPVRKKLVLG